MEASKLQASGTCECGKVKVTVSGAPMSSLFCHCTDCQRAHCAPMVSIAIFPTQQVEFSYPKGGDKETNLIATKLKDHGPTRYCCRSCGIRVGGQRFAPPIDFIGVATQFLNETSPLPDAYKPTMHIFYTERVLTVKDSLPKYAKFPAAWGGNDELVKDD